MEDLTAQWESEGFDQTSDSEIEYLMLSDSSTSSPAQPSSSTMHRDIVGHAHSGAHIVCDDLSLEEKLSKRQGLLRDRLRELQVRAEVYENPLRTATSQGGRSNRVTEYPNCVYLGSSARRVNLDEQSYWSSQGRPRIPFGWEEKPGRPKHFESDPCFMDCNDEFSTNLSDEESIEFFSAKEEFVDVKKKLSPLKLPPRLQHKSQLTESFRSSLVSSSDDDSESPKLCYEDRMQIMSTRGHSLFLPNYLHSQKGAPDEFLNSDRTHMRVFSLPAELVIGSRGDETNRLHRAKYSPERNGLEVLLASFSPNATEQPRRFFILKDRILNAAILEKSRRILQSHGRSNLKDSKFCNKSDNERDHKNKRTKAKVMTKKLCTSFKCGRSSDVIVPASNRPIQRISF
ncbi:hypothetical protein O6H91_04G093200 [Diphasiastrum complanatum]|uniref:Uncharacterized protein n=1 Tax=Diphasiastrum complanatum TaxID=34168 RepID=A0ACC2DZJ4_DIPCM|nr:hypothetical protein O6H91_04G093200 [Diphasiastrum complanatum]